MKVYGNGKEGLRRSDDVAIPILVPQAPAPDPTEGRGGKGDAWGQKHVKFSEPVSGRFDLRGISSSAFHPSKKKEKARALWLVYIIYGTLFVLVVGLMVSVGARLRRPSRAPGSHRHRGARSAGPAFIDCVRIVSSPNSSLVDGAVDEVWRAGLGTRRFSVQQLPLNPESHKNGCFDAHREAHRWAVAQDCQTTLVVEDDVVFADDIADRWGPVARLVESGADWDTVWLGYVGIRIDPVPKIPGLVHLQKPMLAHAVLFSRATSERILALPPWEDHELSILEAYDVSLWHSNATRPRTTFGLDPPAAAQLPSRAESYSLDKNAASDFFKTFWGMAAFNYWARKACSPMYQLSPAISRVIGAFVTLSPDTRSVQQVYACDDVETLG